MEFHVDSFTTSLVRLTIITVLLAICHSQRLEPKDVVVVILSQPIEYDSNLAQDLKTSVQQQAHNRKQIPPTFHTTHEEFEHPGVWTILPLIPKLEKKHAKNKSWILFCQPSTKIDLERLMELLRKYDPRQEKWISYALRDRDATIIHHFAMPKNPGGFKYPSFASGVILSRALLQRIAQRLKGGDFPKQADFSIDAAYELALYIWNEGQGSVLSHSDALCIRTGPHCATRPILFQTCGKPMSKEEIFFAVKTCSKFHKDRLPVVQSTWGRQVKHIEYFSDVEDNAIGTMNIGVPNTDRGHCGKTMAILRHISRLWRKHPRIKWVVVADDDTILGVGRLQQLLSCYNSSDYIALGERYGYNVALPNNYGGYNYITGGGGMVFSMPVVKALTKPNGCNCPSDSTPDDMFLGICLANSGIPVIHSPHFHQARPADYAAEYLAAQQPVSFHKHWMVDPIKVYQDWFESSDRLQAPGEEVHTEL